jgi:flagellar FliL protein
MAKKNSGDDLNLGVEEATGSKKKIIIMGLAAVLLLVTGGGAAYFFLLPDDRPKAAEQSEAEQTEQIASSEPALYHPLDPRFVVNLEGRPSLLQAEMQVMTRDPDLIEFLEQNNPLIRDRLLSLLMAQRGDQLKQRSGKEALQSQLLEEIHAVLSEQEVPGKLEAIYFTSFVMQ